MRKVTGIGETVYDIVFRDGQPQEYEFEGFHARVMCHEYDHLDGILYPDKATKMYRVDPDAQQGETEES